MKSVLSCMLKYLLNLTVDKPQVNPGLERRAEAPSHNPRVCPCRNQVRARPFRAESRRMRCSAEIVSTFLRVSLSAAGKSRSAKPRDVVAAHAGSAGKFSPDAPPPNPAMFAAFQDANAADRPKQ